MTARPEPVAIVPMHGIPCSVCEYPADGILMHQTVRAVYHLDRSVSPCVIPNPPKPEPVVVPAQQQNAA